MAKKKQTIKIDGSDIAIIKEDSGDYICITDMAKSLEGDAGEYIRNWLRTGNTVEFLGAWERFHNPNFNLVEFHQIKSELTKNTFLMSVKKWLSRTNATGIIAKAGRYGGTYAHSDIAIQFATWLSPEFYVYLIQEFQKLKAEEAKKLNSPWSIRREISKANYQILTESIKEQIIPNQLQGTKKEGIFFASEADLLNKVVFGMTAKQFKNQQANSKGNLRDNATVVDLLILANLEALNSRLIHWDCDQEQRYLLLTESALDFRRVLEKNPATKRIANQANSIKKLE